MWCIYMTLLLLGVMRSGLENSKDFLQTQFHTKDLDALKSFLDIEVMRSKKGLFCLTQIKYVLDLFKESRLLGAKLVENPMVSYYQTFSR